MSAALNSETAVCSGATIAEGIAVKNVGTQTLPVVEKLVDEVVTVSEAEIEREWNAEAVRRYQEYKDGKAEAIPADDVFRRMEDRYAK